MQVASIAAQVLGWLVKVSHYWVLPFHRVADTTAAVVVAQPSAIRRLCAMLTRIHYWLTTMRVHKTADLRGTPHPFEVWMQRSAHEVKTRNAEDVWSESMYIEMDNVNCEAVRVLQARSLTLAPNNLNGVLTLTEDPQKTGNCSNTEISSLNSKQK